MHILKIFNLIIFITLINSSFSYLAFNFPHAFKLDNKNIFVIHQLGITICDETFTESIKRVITFSESEQIKTDASLSRVTSIKAENYVICLINDKIYFFNKEGNFIGRTTSPITSLSVDYYSFPEIE